MVCCSDVAESGWIQKTAGCAVYIPQGVCKEDMSWADATAFCKASGESKRLCTKTEVESKSRVWPPFEKLSMVVISRAKYQTETES